MTPPLLPIDLGPQPPNHNGIHGDDHVLIARLASGTYMLTMRMVENPLYYSA